MEQHHTLKTSFKHSISQYLEIFSDKNKWPPRSPDLKARVYCPLRKTIDELKLNIRREIGKIDKKMFKKTYENF